jgi:hypothetical protein
MWRVGRVEDARLDLKASMVLMEEEVASWTCVRPSRPAAARVEME